MALIQCPECSKQISDQAETCPSCGLHKPSEKNPQKESPPPEYAACPHCDTRLDVAGFQVGESIQCGACHKTFRKGQKPREKRIVQCPSCNTNLDLSDLSPSRKIECSSCHALFFAPVDREPFLADVSEPDPTNVPEKNEKGKGCSFVLLSGVVIIVLCIAVGLILTQDKQETTEVSLPVDTTPSSRIRTAREDVKKTPEPQVVKRIDTINWVRDIKWGDSPTALPSKYVCKREMENWKTCSYPAMEARDHMTELKVEYASIKWAKAFFHFEDDKLKFIIIRKPIAPINEWGTLTAEEEKAFNLFLSIFASMKLISPGQKPPYPSNFFMPVIVETAAKTWSEQSRITEKKAEELIRALIAKSQYVGLVYRTTIQEDERVVKILSREYGEYDKKTFKDDGQYVWGDRDRRVETGNGSVYFSPITGTLTAFAPE